MKPRYVFPLLAAILLLQQPQDTQIGAQLPIPAPAPTAAAADPVITADGPKTLAKVGGKWVFAEEVLVVEAFVEVEGTPTSVIVEASQIIKTKTQDGQSIEVLSATPVPVIRVPASNKVLFALDAPAKGTYLVSVFADYEETGVTLVRQRVVVGTDPEPEPEPDKPEPEPQPTVPDDVFDNIGQRVAAWSKGLPKRKEVAANYKKYSGLLMTDLSQSINTASAAMVKERAEILGADAAKYTEMISLLNADFQARWPLGKFEVAEYWKAVAAGLEGSK